MPTQTVRAQRIDINATMTLLLNLNCRKVGIYHLTNKFVERHPVTPTKFVVGLSRIAN
jgi:hypothetical protein